MDSTVHVGLGTGHSLCPRGEVWGSLRKERAVGYAFSLCTHGSDFPCYSVISCGRQRNEAPERE